MSLRDCPKYIVGYFKLLNLNPEGPADSREVTTGRPPVMEICLIPADQVISCLQDGQLYRVPAGAITFQLRAGDPFPDVYDCMEFQQHKLTAQKRRTAEETPERLEIPAPD